MKKRGISIILFASLLVMLAAIVSLVFLRFDDLASVLHSNGTMTSAAKDAYLNFAVLSLLWIVLLFLFIAVEKNVSLFSGNGDRLTGLASRRKMQASYEAVVSSYGKCCCLAYIAFDEKRVAARYDVSWSERLQKGAALLLSEVCDKDDCVSRIGDGEFALLLCCRDGLQAQQKIDVLTDRLNKYQRQLLLERVAPFRSGIYLPEGNLSFEEALNNAKLGYRYASDNRDDTFLCTEEHLLENSSRTRLREKLQNAIDSDQFETYLQFVYSVEKRCFIGAEVLSRWNDPETGMVMPAYYINDLRTIGLIEQFDMYMLEKTCRLLAEWGKGEFSDLILSCNVTRVTISSVDFLSNLQQIVNRYQFDHKRLIIEITEDALINNETVAGRNIVECRSDGFQVAIDDFGAGHSSLDDINHYPVNQLKIDRELVNKVFTRRGADLLCAIVQLAHHLDIKVTCEGVENKKQRDAIIETGCDYIQGYLYSYVYSLDEAKTFYRQSLSE